MKFDTEPPTRPPRPAPQAASPRNLRVRRLSRSGQGRDFVGEFLGASDSSSLGLTLNLQLSTFNRVSFLSPSSPHLCVLCGENSLSSRSSPIPRHLPLTAKSFTIRTSETPLPQPLYNPHLQASLGSAGNKGLMTPLESALTRNSPVSLLESALTKTGGWGVRSIPVRRKRETRRYKGRTVSGFDLAGGGVPGHGRAPEIRFVGHVAGQRGVMAEDGVLRRRLAVLHALEEFPEMRFFLVPGDPAIRESFGDWFFAGLRIVLRMPLLEVSLTHGPRIADGVIARRLILARLREVGNGGFRDFQDSLGALETVNLRRFAAEIQAQIDRGASVIEKRGLDIRHVAPVRETQNTAESHGALGRFVPAEHVIYAADEVDEQISRDASAVFFPAAPARENLGIKFALWHVALPGVPIDCGRRRIRRRRIFPGAGGVVAAERALHQSECADNAAREKLFCFCADDRAHALRSDLHDASGFLRGGHHRNAVGGGMGHRLFAINVFARADGIDDNFFVPVIRHGGDDAIDFLVVEEFLIAARRRNFRAGDFLGEGVAPVVEIGGSDALDARQLNGVREEAGTLHADADDAEAYAVARRDGARRQRNLFWIQDHRARGYVRTGGAGAALEEFTAGKIFFHFALLEEIESRRLKVKSRKSKTKVADDCDEKPQASRQDRNKFPPELQQRK